MSNPYLFCHVETTLIPYHAIHCLPARSVLALAPHPDDEVFGCGGSLVRHVQSGCQVHVVVASDGAFGATAIRRDQVTATRQAESRAAAALLGYPPPDFWGLPDRGVVYCEALIRRLMAEIRVLDVDLVYAPALTEMHPDHRSLAMAAVEAVRRLGPGVRLAMYEVGVPLTPNTLLDITDVASLKRSAMQCFPSQLAVQAYDEHIAALNRFRTYTLPAEVKMAEAYCLYDGAYLSQASLTIFDSEYIRQAKLGLPVFGALDIPLVSVVVRSMGRETLTATLDSLSLQTYQNVEVIVVNAAGGAHSDIGDRCGRFPMHFTNANGMAVGRGAAANAGLRVATGELLAFLDDDDTLDPDHISILVGIVQSNAPTPIVACSGVRALIRDENHPTRTREIGQVQFDQRTLLLGNPLPANAPLFSKAMVTRGASFDETLGQYGDWDFWMQLSELAPFIYSGRVTATHFLEIPSAALPRGQSDPVDHSMRAKLIDKWSHRMGSKTTSELSELFLKIGNSSIGNFENLAAAADFSRDLINSPSSVQLKPDCPLPAAPAIEQQAVLERSLAPLDVLAKQQTPTTEPRQDRTSVITRLEQNVIDLQNELIAANNTIVALKVSTSWRLTKPVRFVGHKLLQIETFIKALTFAASTSGGYRKLAGHIWRSFRREGIAGIKHRAALAASHRMPTSNLSPASYKEQNYEKWLHSYDYLTNVTRRRAKKRIAALQRSPMISVMMSVCGASLDNLEDAIRSVQKQLYLNWELCISGDASTIAPICDLLQRFAANDARIKIILNEDKEDVTASYNHALNLASGEYLALLDNSDVLHELSLFWVVDAILNNPDAGLIYSDEDKLDATGNRCDPYFKPDWNPDLFHSHNFISHLTVYRTALVKELGGFRKEYEEAHEFDLALRCIEQLNARQIVHIPRVLYHCRHPLVRVIRSETGVNPALSAGQRAVNEHFVRTGTAAKAELLDMGMYRVRYDLPLVAPLVTLIIPTRNSLVLVQNCVESILAKTTYRNYEILIVDNGSDDKDALAYFEKIVKTPNIRVRRDEREFNYSALNNAAVQQAQGTYIGLLNNDIEVITPGWLEEMISLASQPAIGAVGARLWYPNNTLQHGGVITGIGSGAGHSHKHLTMGSSGYFHQAQLIKTVTAVTAACLIVKKDIFQSVGGLDEVNLKIGFNDVDFCLRVRQAGYRNVWTPYADLYHHESATRGYEDTPEKQRRFRREARYLSKRWGKSLHADPAYNPNLTLEREDFSLAWPPRVDPV